MLTITKHFAETLNKFTEEQQEEKIQFLLRTAHLVNAYVEQTKENDCASLKDRQDRHSYQGLEQAKPFGGTRKRGKWGNTTIVNNDQKREKLQMQYFHAVGISPTAAQNANFRKNAREQLDVADCCDAPDIVILPESAVCQSCGCVVKHSTQYAQTMNDGGGVSNGSRAVMIVDSKEDVDIVDKTALVNRALLRVQGLRVSSFKYEEWVRLYKNVTENIKDTSMMSSSMINAKLQKADKKYAKDIYVIWEKVTGKKLMHISDAIIWLINYQIANRIVIKPNTKPRILAMTLLYKCFQLCGENKLAKLLVMQHAEANMNTFDPIWKQTCEMHNFKYMSK